jgi:hypothetical protein
MLNHEPDAVDRKWVTHSCSAVMFEILHGALVLFSRLARVESPEIPAFACLGIQFPRIQSILTQFQFANHGAPRRATYYTKSTGRR